jgi:predicted Zn-dependent protease
MNFRNALFVPLMFAVLSCVSFLRCSNVTGWVASFLISEEQEVELGNRFKAEILRDTDNYPQYKGNDRVNEFIDSLGEVLADIQKDRDTLVFSFTVIDDDEQINAFAIPGGHVFVYTGLLLASDNLAEVAGVLAHEIGHITMYHGRNLLMKQAAFGLVETILFGEDSASVGRAIADLLGNMAFLKFSRDNEFQADSCSVAYTTKAGINPAGMKAFLQTLRDEYGDNPDIFEPFSTHPPLKDRIEGVEGVIENTSGASMGSGENLFRDEFRVIRDLL